MWTALHIFQFLVSMETIWPSELQSHTNIEIHKYTQRSKLL